MNSANRFSQQLSRIAPAVGGASAFACADVLGKVVLNSGADVLTLATFRSYVGIALLYAWMRVGTRPAAIEPRARRVSLALGVLFAGNVFLLFKSFETIPVPVAILLSFAYPILTGLAAAATGLEKLSFAGAVAAMAAFLGLTLMVGAHPGGLATAGIVAALGAAFCRVGMLLVTRARLAGVDARLITWYSLVSSTALFSAVSLATLNWQAPATAAGWIALLLLGLFTTIGIFAVYASTVTLGPFRTALLMNLEPLLATVGSAIFLGEMLSPLQAAGGVLLLTALVSFQLKR